MVAHVPAIDVWRFNGHEAGGGPEEDAAAPRFLRARLLLPPSEGERPS